MPPDFQQRLGKEGDFFYSGVFPSAGLRIGYLRIPALFAFAGSTPFPDSAGIAQFASEITYLEANTDGLVIDIMHNPGGSPIYADAIYSYLSPQPYLASQAALRPSLILLAQTMGQLERAKASQADAETIEFYQNMLEQAQAAYAQGADLTPPFLWSARLLSAIRPGMARAGSLRIRNPLCCSRMI